MSSEKRTCEPGASVCKRAAAAAIPEEKTRAQVPPSSSRSAASRRDCVGFFSRAYMNPWMASAAGPCSKVVGRCKGGESAPVAESVSAPAWTAMVSRRSFSACWAAFRVASRSEVMLLVINVFRSVIVLLPRLLDLTSVNKFTKASIGGQATSGGGGERNVYKVSWKRKGGEQTAGRRDSEKGA